MKKLLFFTLAEVSNATCRSKIKRNSVRWKEVGLDFWEYFSQWDEACCKLILQAPDMPWEMKEMNGKHQLKIAVEKCNLRISLHAIFAYLVLPTFVLHMMLVCVIVHRRRGVWSNSSDTWHSTVGFWIHVFTTKFCFCGNNWAFSINSTAGCLYFSYSCFCVLCMSNRR